MTLALEQAEKIEKRTFVPDEAFLAAFHAQYSRELLKKAERFTVYMVMRIGALHRKGDVSYARALVQNAVSDTLVGDLSWNYSDKPLQQHVFDVIRTRIRDERDHEAKFRTERFDADDPHDPVVAEMETSKRDLDSASQQPARSAAIIAIKHLREESVGDDDALRILDSFLHGVSKRSEVMRLAHLSDERYRAAWMRISRRAQDLPNQLWSAVRSRA